MRFVKVRAMKAFDNHSVGDIFWAPMVEPLAHLIVDHYLELMWDPTWDLVDDGPSSDVPPGTEGNEQG